MNCIKIFVTSLFLTVIATITAIAGQWKFDDYTWKKLYQRDDGTYPVNQWEQIDGNWYYFDGNGWMMTNSWIQSKYYVGDDGVKIFDGQTNDGFMVDSEGVYIPGSGNRIDGTYRFLKVEAEYIYDGNNVPDDSWYGKTVEVKRVSDKLITVTTSGKWNYGEKSSYRADKYYGAERYTYFSDNIDGISFKNGNLIFWPEEGDVGDYYICIYKKM